MKNKITLLSTFINLILVCNGFLQENLFSYFGPSVFIVAIVLFILSFSALKEKKWIIFGFNLILFLFTFFAFIVNKLFIETYQH